MKIKNIEIETFINDKNINSKFINTEYKNFELKCNILKGNFYADTFNYYPLTKEMYSFYDMFKWGEKRKYDNFYTEEFIKNFDDNKDNFKNLSDIFILGSSSQDNYYRNITAFLPRIFFHSKNKIKLGIHRNSSNKFRNFLELLCKQMNIKISFVYLDDNFYNFTNSEIPQFFNMQQSALLLNKLRIKNKLKKNKIYISRQNCNYRNLVNEDDVIIKLKGLGFQILDLNDYEISEQVNLFSNAEIVVSPTGSGLTNIVFCKKGTKIFEISPKYQFEYEDTFKYRFSGISEVLNLKYCRINADSIEIDKTKKSNNFLSANVLENSNYYKNLIVKLEMIDKVI